MANYTPNYQLHQWAPEDKFLRTDFNEDLNKIDTALGDSAAKTAALEAAVSKCGNCRIVSGNYMGKGESGESHPNKLSFDRPPLLVIVCPNSQYSRSELDRLVLVRNAPWSFTVTNISNSACTVIWSGNVVKWHGYNDYYQANRNGEKYHYVALLAAD